MGQVRDAWVAWDWDVPTLVFLVVFVFGFGVFEYLTSTASPFPTWRGNMITHHLQPLFDAAPVLRAIGFGIWLWIGPHILFPNFERMITSFARGAP